MIKSEYTDTLYWEESDIGRRVKIVLPSWYVDKQTMGYNEFIGMIGTVIGIDGERWSGEVRFANGGIGWFFGREVVFLPDKQPAQLTLFTPA